jgi:MurNAc alpha-1-phosphate uridylyltransferase
MGWTYSGVGLYTPAFFAGVAPGKLALRPLLDAAILQGRLVGERFTGDWQDVGTPERLRALDIAVSARA